MGLIMPDLLFQGNFQTKLLFFYNPFKTVLCLAHWFLLLTRWLRKCMLSLFETMMRMKLKKCYMQCGVWNQTEDMILALAGQFKQLSHEPEKFRWLNGIRTHDLCDALSSFDFIWSYLHLNDAYVCSFRGRFLVRVVFTVVTFRFATTRCCYGY